VTETCTADVTVVTGDRVVHVPFYLILYCSRWRSNDTLCTLWNAERAHRYNSKSKLKQVLVHVDS